MNIKETVFNLQKVFAEMGETFSAFQTESGLQCLPGCGQCCRFPDIESTVLESLPFALKVYEEGRLDEWIEKLEKSDGLCILWEGDSATGKGRCTNYEYRPSVCRVFGASGYFDKSHEVALSVCKLIKDASPEMLERARSGRNAENTPIIANWYTKIQSLGTPELLQRYPINKAILEALKLVGFYAQYQSISKT